MKRLLRRTIALPADHGAWVFLLSPLLIGMFLAGRAGWETALLAGAALAAFLLRHPVTILVKVYSARRGQADLPAAWFWTAVYATAGGLALAWLARHGFGQVFVLAVPGMAVFVWHLWLVARRAERRQMGVDVVASGTLALAAPAAYWVGTGTVDALGWWLWGLAWLQSAASIVHAFLRLEQRAGPAPKGLERRALGYTGVNLALAAILSVTGMFPAGLWIPYAVQFGETVYGVKRPATNLRPTQIGLRQLAVSTLFTIMFILVWRV